MLTQIFKNILIMSAVGTLLSAFLLCLKPITRKLFSPNWQYYIWLTVLIVMILPVRFSLPDSISNISAVVPNQAENIEAEVPQGNDETADIQIPGQTERISVPKIELPQNILYHSANIWFLGMFIILLAKSIKYKLFLRTIYKNSEVYTDIPNIPKHLKVRKTDMLDAPLLVGIFRPVLLLPNTEFAENDMNYILMHELTHYKRCDLLYKWFAMLVKSVHWFNPFAYIVSNQIDLECEISCDFNVTVNLSDSEKKDYMSMILSLLRKSGNHPRQLTTQMASGKKTLKRRFAMIGNKKTTGKVVSAISAVLAAVIFSGTVFASGILSDFATDDYTVEIINNGEKIALVNKPFIENGEVYVPLRETLEKVMQEDEGIAEIQWTDGTIDVAVVYYRGTSGKYQLKIGGKFVKLEHISYEDYKNNSAEKSIVATALSLKQSPVLRNQTTYVTLKDLNYMLYGYTVKKDENNNTRKLTYTIYDKNGEITATESNPSLLADVNADILYCNLETQGKSYKSVDKKEKR